jgi:hypothetical protein
MDTLPSPEDIAELVAYLPRLYAEGFQPVIEWGGGDRNSAGHFRMPYPVYDELVRQFFRSAAKECWLDFNYKPEEAGRLLHEHPERIATLSLPELRSVLTYCVRFERFSDGHWGEMIERGHIRRILERLQELGQ